MIFKCFCALFGCWLMMIQRVESFSASSSSSSKNHHHNLPPVQEREEEEEEGEGRIITINPYQPPYITVSNSGTTDYNNTGPPPPPPLLSNIHIVPLLTPTETNEALRLAYKYAEESQCWSQGKKGGTQHSSYNTVDFPLISYDDIDDGDDDKNILASYLDSIGFHDRVFGLLSKNYDVDVDSLDYEDLFCVQYVANNDVASNTNYNTSNDKQQQTTMDRLALHRDGTFLSFTVLLTDPSNFEGGGTEFDALADIKLPNDLFKGYVNKNTNAITPQSAGQCCLHSGKYLHGGQIVTSGTRIIIVGFVHVDPWITREGELAEACKQFGRLDVAKKIHHRQLALHNKFSANNNTKVLLREKSLPFVKHPSVLRLKPAPMSFAMKNRSQEDYQSRRKREVEKKLIQNLFLAREERQQQQADNELNMIMSSFGGDISII